MLLPFVVRFLCAGIGPRRPLRKQATSLPALSIPPNPPKTEISRTHRYVGAWFAFGAIKDGAGMLWDAKGLPFERLL